MKVVFSLLFIFLFQYSYGQVLLEADGPGDTYELITSVLAPGNNPIEVPDCNHNAFGDHIDEVFDSTLNMNVFRFYIHTSPDNDRCINFDRQRNEIKSYSPSPDNLLGIEDEKVVYKWKFKLDSGFQSSPNFTHIHQLKSVGGSLASMPMYTLTTRKGSPDRLELRYAQTNSQITLKQTDLEPFIGSWLEVTEIIKYGISGTYEIEIKRIGDDETLFEYSNPSIINWRSGAQFVRPKWGIYRSLDNAQDLRDETVLFASFSIEEIEVVSSEKEQLDNAKIVFENPVYNTIYIKELPKKTKLIEVYGLNGTKYLEVNVESRKQFQLDVSSLSSGTYILKFSGEEFFLSKAVQILGHK